MDLANLLRDLLRDVGPAAFSVFALIWMLVLANRSVIQSRERAEDDERKETARRTMRETWEREQAARVSELEFEFRQTLSKQANEATRQRDDLLVRIGKLNQQTEAMETTIAGLRKQLEEAGIRESEAIKEARAVHDRLEQAKRDLQAAANELAQANKRTAELETKVAEMQTTIDRMEKVNLQLHNDIERLKTGTQPVVTVNQSEAKPDAPPEA